MEIIGARDMENLRPLFNRCWTNCRAQCRYVTQFFNNNTGLSWNHDEVNMKEKKKKEIKDNLHLITNKIFIDVLYRDLLYR